MTQLWRHVRYRFALWRGYLSAHIDFALYPDATVWGQPRLILKPDGSLWVLHAFRPRCSRVFFHLRPVAP